MSSLIQYDLIWGLGIVFNFGKHFPTLLFSPFAIVALLDPLVPSPSFPGWESEVLSFPFPFSISMSELRMEGAIPLSVCSLIPRPFPSDGGIGFSPGKLCQPENPATFIFSLFLLPLLIIVSFLLGPILQYILFRTCFNTFFDIWWGLLRLAHMFSIYLFKMALRLQFNTALMASMLTTHLL